MGLFEFFWDINQQQRINEAHAGLDQQAGRVAQTERELDELRRAVDQLSLMNQALWEVVRDRTGLSDAELAARVKEVDGRDGQIDGRMTAAPARCPKCGKVNAAHRSRCLYCGADL